MSERIEPYRTEPYKEGELNIETPEQAEAEGERMMTPTQEEMSKHQEKLFKELGMVMLKSKTEGFEISEEDKQKWPDADRVDMLSGQLRDGRKIMLKSAFLRKPHGDTSYDFVGTINDQSLPAHIAKSLYVKYARTGPGILIPMKDYYADAERANQEMSSGASSGLWEDLL